MFAIEQPSMALNDTNLDVVVRMEITKTIQPTEGISQILSHVVNAAKGVPGGKLKNLILNCHGDPGELHMGSGITRQLTDRFAMLAPDGKPLVETIYLRSCKVARIDGGGGSSSDGNLFCSAIAKSAKCVVVASTATQTTGYRNSYAGALPQNMLDIYEGTTLHYGPEGNVLKSATNPMWSNWSRAE
jgi:hypothetical protein